MIGSELLNPSIQIEDALSTQGVIVYVKDISEETIIQLELTEAKEDILSYAGRFSSIERAIKHIRERYFGGRDPPEFIQADIPIHSNTNNTILIGADCFVYGNLDMEEPFCLY